MKGYQKRKYWFSLPCGSAYRILQHYFLIDKGGRAGTIEAECGKRPGKIGTRNAFNPYDMIGRQYVKTLLINILFIRVKQ